MKPVGLNQKAPVDRRYGNTGQGQSVGDLIYQTGGQKVSSSFVKDCITNGRERTKIQLQLKNSLIHYLICFNTLRGN